MMEASKSYPKMTIIAPRKSVFKKILDSFKMVSEVLLFHDVIEYPHTFVCYICLLH
jgi:hypothetical protein